MRDLARIAWVLAAVCWTVQAAASDDPFEAFRQGRYDDARRGFEALRHQQPRDPAAAINLGSALYQLGRFDDAAAVLQTAVELSAGALRQQALYDLGNATFRLSRYADAANHFEAALKLDPADVDAAHNLELARQKLASLQGPPPPPNRDPDSTPPQHQPLNPENAQPRSSPEPSTAPESATSRSAPSMTRQEAERLLSSLEDQPPPRQHGPKKHGRPRASKPGSGKDW